MSIELTDGVRIITITPSDGAASVVRAEAAALEASSSATSAGNDATATEADRVTVQGLSETVAVNTAATYENADRAEAAADRVGNLFIDGTVADLLADPRGYDIFTEGQALTVLDGGFSYVVAPSDATDHHLTTTAGVKVYIQAEGGVCYSVLAAGAPTDKTSDASAAIDVIFAAAATTGGTVVFPSLDDDAYSASFKTTTQHTVPNGVSLKMDGVLETSYAGDAPALIVGTPSTYNHRVKIEVQIVRATYSDWSSENVVGVQVNRTNMSEIYLRYITNFTVNAEFAGDGGGFVHNTITKGELLNAKKQIKLVARNNGWVNRNELIGGGRLGWSSGVNTTLNRYGVCLERDNSPYFLNSNVIGMFDFEPASGTFTEAVPLVMEGAVRNKATFSDDVSKGVQCRLLGESSMNQIEALYDGNSPIDVEDLSHRGDNIYRKGRSLFLDRSRSVWSSGFLPKMVVGYGSATGLTTKGHSGYKATGAAIDVNGVAVTETYLQIGASAGVARRIHPKAGVQYVVTRDVLEGYEGRLAFKCFDSSGTLLTGVIPASNDRADSTAYALNERVRFLTSPYNTGGLVFKCTTAGATAAAEPSGIYSVGDTIADGTCVWTAEREVVVTQQGVNPFYTATSFGGCFRFGSDSGTHVMLMFTSDVEYVDIILHGGTASCRVTGWSISSIDGSPVVTSHPLGLDDDTFYTYQSPSVTGSIGQGGYSIGQRVYDSSPASGTPQGWACSVSGDPGTWVAMPNF